MAGGCLCTELNIQHWGTVLPSKEEEQQCPDFTHDTHTDLERPPWSFGSQDAMEVYWYHKGIKHGFANVENDLHNVSPPAWYNHQSF